MKFRHVFLLAMIWVWPAPDPPLTTYPAVLSVYDPGLCPELPINCDSDPSVFSTMIPVTDDWYGVAAACHPDLLGRQVTFPGIGTWTCVDSGPLIGVDYNEYYGRPVLYFDLMVPLQLGENNEVLGYPDWTWLLVHEWELH